jgi:hypothetical protein
MSQLSERESTRRFGVAGGVVGGVVRLLPFDILTTPLDTPGARATASWH